MNTNPAIPYPATVSGPVTLNDLRMRRSFAEERSSPSAPSLSGPVVALFLAVFLAIGVFIWRDPLHLLAPKEASPPAPARVARVPSPEPERLTETQEIVAPPTPIPPTKSAEVPIAPAPVVQAPHVPAPMVRPRAASIKPEEKTAPPVLLAKPEERADEPVVLKLRDDTRNAPKPAATNDQTPGTD